MFKRLWLIVWLTAPGLALADDYSPPQLKSWQAYCASELDGDEAFCACVLDAQVREIGAEKVRINLDSMIVDDPDATEADADAANDRLGDISEETFGETLMLFELSLETAMGGCE
jgi:hypothetical protein